MKVCTDACILGAYVSKQIPLDNSKKVLDIGTGTGLLSLMYAQNNPAPIDAIEIDILSARQAKENFAASKWNEQINMICADVNSWQNYDQYDLIISNPPFYEADLNSPDKRRNNALHSTSLSLNQLLHCINKYMQPSGKVALLLPAVREQAFKQAILPHELLIEKKLNIYQKKDDPLFRFIAILSREQLTSNDELFIIYETDGSYTNQFTDLLREYYLKL